MFGVLPALAVHGFQALFVLGQGGHALGAVGRNDAPCARLLHSQGAAYLFVVAPGPQGKAHINDAKSHPIRPPACVFHHSINPLLEIRIRQLVVFAEK